MIRTQNVGIVIPTQGRITLERCLESLMARNQGGYGAEVIVVADTFQMEEETKQHIRTLTNKYYAAYVEHNAGHSDWGYPQLNYVYRHVPLLSDYVCNIGDDDVFEAGVLPQIIEILSKKPLSLFMFQVALFPSPNRGNQRPVILWNDESRDIERKKVTGQNLFVPKIPTFMGNWTDDFVFMKELWHNQVTWVPLVTCRCY